MIDSYVRVVIDIGSSLVRVVIAQVGDEQPLEILAIGVSRNEGIKRGVITDIMATTLAVKKAIASAESQAGLKIHSASVSISGAYLLAVNSDAKLNLRHRKVSENDISEVICRARDVANDSNYQFIHVFPQTFVVDEYPGISAPKGMAADMIEAHVHVISARRSQIENVMQCIEKAGVEVSNLVFEGVAVSQVALTEEERDLGACVVDLGAGTIKYMVWEQNYPLHSGIISIGGELVSSDLALVLKTPRPFAETLKCQQGAAILSLLKEQQLEVPSTGLRPSRMIDAQEVVDIIVNRYIEMFELLQKDLHRAGFREPLTSGFIFTGGAALMSGLCELAESFFEAPVRVARPEMIAGLPDHLQHDPSLWTALGMIDLQYRPLLDYVLENSEKQGIIKKFRYFLQRYV